MDLGERLLAERRARLAAERLLELKSRELFAANRKLSEHARLLSEEIVVQRRVVQSAQSAAEELKGENVRVRSDLEKATIAQTIAERRLWEALDTIRDGFAIYDAQERLVVANRAYLAVFEDLEEVGPGIHFADLLRIGMEEGVFDPEGRSPADWTRDMLARWQDEAIEPSVIRLWNRRYIRLVDRRGADGGIVSLALDITDTIRREAELREARVRAEAANRAKSAFLANMSHELRTPMNGVVGMAELLGETALSEEQRLYAETIKSSGEALLEIINDVLDYSKLEAEKLHLHPEPFDLERLIHEVVMMLSPSAAEKGLSMSVDYDLFLPTALIGDRGRVRQVLTNLVGNAVKFTLKGHVLVRVVGLEAGQGRHRITVAVEDTGIGIAPEMRDHIFGEFNQVEDERNRKFEGTGLGLAISRRLVRLMGGEIWVESAPGLGSCFAFRLELPCAEPAAPPEPRLNPSLRSALIVDPDTMQRTILQRQLAALGIEVDATRSAEGAREVLARSPERQGWDSVFADAGIPAEELAHLAAPAGGGAPAAAVVRLAASPAQASIATAEGSAAQVLLKPVMRRDLFGALERIGEALEAREPARPPTPSPADPPRAPRRPLRILAAEDNRTNQLVFTRMLKGLPVEITLAANGAEAVERFAEVRPDLVFMDISMPEMDGREATRRIRAFESEAGLPRTPVVALTAHAMEGDAEDILAAGLDRHLSKPLRKAAILAAIADFCPGWSAAAPQDAVAAG